jgi:hypothetical protein
MTTLELVLSVITALSGFGNLTQWVNLRALRDKARYEADNAHIDSLKKIIELQQQEIIRLQERQKELEARILTLEKHGNN